MISYVRSQIVHFRLCGVRGAIDFAALYLDAMDLWEHEKDLSSAAQASRPVVKKRAEELFGILAQKTNTPEQALYTVGRNVAEDAVVKYIWNIWFDNSKHGDTVSGSPLEQGADGQKKRDAKNSGEAPNSPAAKGEG